MKEVEECECEEKKEKAKKRNQNQAVITRYETYKKHHHWHISNLELVLRQIDNHIINPYDVEPIIDAVSDYIQHYRDSDFIFDDSVYEGFDLNSAPAESESDLSGDDTLELSSSESRANSVTPVTFSLLDIRPHHSRTRFATCSADRFHEWFHEWFHQCYHQCYHQWFHGFHKCYHKWFHNYYKSSREFRHSRSGDRFIGRFDALSRTTRGFPVEKWNLSPSAT